MHGDSCRHKNILKETDMSDGVDSEDIAAHASDETVSSHFRGGVLSYILKLYED